jgi:AcrR family transcriptional regulator
MATIGRAADRVKARRAYDSTRRQEHARQMRDRLLDVAERRFLTDGYEPTTIASIAAEAGVSVDTIYKSFGGKPGLIRGIRARALLGSDPVPAEQRSDELQARERDPRQIIRGWAGFTVELAPRAAPILLLLRDASASDPDLRALLRELDADRLRRMTENARRLASAGHLRSGVSAADAATVLWTYSAPELYELLVLRRGMPLDQFGRFIADAMIAAVLSP